MDLHAQSKWKNREEATSGQKLNSKVNKEIDNLVEKIHHMVSSSAKIE